MHLFGNYILNRKIVKREIEKINQAHKKSIEELNHYFKKETEKCKNVYEALTNKIKVTNRRKKEIEKLRQENESLKQINYEKNQTINKLKK